jgi:glucokinase
MKKTVIGLDIGGTKIWAQEYTTEGSPLGDPRTLPTNSIEGCKAVMDQIVAAIDPLVTKKTIGVGISWAGFVDPASGMVKTAPNIAGFANVPVAKIVHERTGLHVVLENDAKLFALGEAHAREKMPTSLLGVIVGTGVGIGIVLDGKIYAGHTGSAGECGHSRIGTEKTEIEALIAGRGIDAAVAGFGYEQMGYKERNRTIVADKEKHAAALHQNLVAFGHWLASLALTFDPEVIVVGGGAGIHFWQHWEPELMRIASEALDGYPVDLRLEWSQQKNAGALGAAMLCVAQEK